MPVAESSRLGVPKDFIMRVSSALMAYLNTHAFIRDVDAQELARDVIRSWIRRRTPAADPRFRLDCIGFPMVDGPTEKWDGYVVSLGFNPEVTVEGKTESWLKE